MAKATLPTNFKDDILASSMGSKRRYNVINNSDGTISLEDVTTYTQVGSTFGAAQINATNKAANAAADASKIIDDYDTLMANTQAGYMAGALAVKELNSNLGYYFYDTFSSTVSGTKKITCGFTPSKIVFYCYMSSASYSLCAAYDKSTSEKTCIIVTTAVSTKTIGNTDCQIKSIDSDGFSLYTTGSGVAGQYVRGIAIP